ncbi:hypothetical protein C8R43DRAFT_969388, partial [Mycena crocata]
MYSTALLTGLWLPLSAFTVDTRTHAMDLSAFILPLVMRNLAGPIELSLVRSALHSGGYELNIETQHSTMVAGVFPVPARKKVSRY